MAVKMSAQLTGANREYNGLNQVEQILIDQPHGTRYAVVAYEVLRTTTEIDEGVIVPTVRIAHIEPVNGTQADAVRELLGERYKDRTGKSLDGDPTLFDGVADGRVADGEREVPEASGEEILAERRERKARAAAVEQPTFSGGGEPA